MELLRALTLGLAPNAPPTPWTAFLTQGNCDPHLFRYVARELGTMDVWTLASHVPGLEEVRARSCALLTHVPFPDARDSQYSPGILYNVQHNWEYMRSLMDLMGAGLRVLYAVLGQVDHETLDRLVRYCYLTLYYDHEAARWLRTTILRSYRIEYLSLLDLVISVNPESGVREVRWALGNLVDTSFEHIPFPFLAEACHLLDHYPSGLAAFATCYESLDIMEYLVGKVPANSCYLINHQIRGRIPAVVEFFLAKFADPHYCLRTSDVARLPAAIADPYRFVGAKLTNIPSVCRK